VRKVYANEFLRFFTAIEDAVMSDLITPNDLKQLSPILALKIKHGNNL